MSIVKDIFIIGSFIATRLSPLLQSFVMRFLDETQAHIALNIAFLLVVLAVVLHNIKSKTKPNTATVYHENVRVYFMGLRGLTITDTIIALAISLVLLGINTPSILLKSTTEITISTSSFLLGTILIIFAAFTEELFYRSYMIAQLQRTMRNIPSILVVSALLFALGHIAYGIENVIFAFSAGIILSLLILLRNSLWANTIAHCTYNVVIYSIAFF